MVVCIGVPTAGAHHTARVTSSPELEQSEHADVRDRGASPRVHAARTHQAIAFETAEHRPVIKLDIGVIQVLLGCRGLEVREQGRVVLGEAAHATLLVSAHQWSLRGLREIKQAVGIVECDASILKNLSQARFGQSPITSKVDPLGDFGSQGDANPAVKGGQERDSAVMAEVGVDEDRNGAIVDYCVGRGEWGIPKVRDSLSKQFPAPVYWLRN